MKCARMFPRDRGNSSRSRPADRPVGSPKGGFITIASNFFSATESSPIPCAASSIKRRRRVLLPIFSFAARRASAARMRSSAGARRSRVWPRLPSGATSCSTRRSKPISPARLNDSTSAVNTRPSSTSESSAMNSLAINSAGVPLDRSRNPGMPSVRASRVRVGRSARSARRCPRREDYW